MAPLRFMVAILAAVSAAYGSRQEAAPFSNPFVVSLTSWSECRRINGTPSCFRTREASCNRSRDGAIAPWYYCEEIGLERPNGVELCPASSCVQGCVVSAWTDWTDCDCSSSPYANRFREIVIPPQNGGEDCPELVQNATCDCPLSLDDTPRNYTWKVGVWGECTAISADCGHGTRSRTVECVNLQEDKVSDVKCLWERAYEHVLPPPIMSVCEVPCSCLLSEWSEWSECEAVCDTAIPHGEQRRARMVLRQPTIGGSCPETEETRTCDVDTSICPQYTWETSEWSTCTFEGGASCGMGLLNRYVYCLEVNENSTIVSDASRCALYTTEPRPSHVAPCQITCPQECIVTEWTEWSPCPVTCNITYSNRTRGVLIPSLAGGNECPHLVEFKQCPVVPCVQWITEDFSACFPESGSCGAGTQSRNFYCGDLAGSEVDSDLCATIPTPARGADCYKPCSDDCVVSEWSSWTTCSQTCGGEIGTQTRTRDIVVYGTQPCLYNSTSLSEIRNCSVEIPCVDSLYFIRGSAWSDCIAEPRNASGELPPSLIEGSQTRTSVCMKDDEVIPSDECPIEFQAAENRSCSVPRPVDCVLSDWSNFSTCSVTCGEGVKTRSRRVIQFASSGGIDCPFNIPSNGLLTETIACQQPSCNMDYSWHVSPWSQCYILPTILSKHSQDAHVMNKHCGVGYRNRSVSCVDSNLHTLDYHLCLEISGEKPTSLQKCLESCTDQCIITEWSEFSQCVNGASTRTREIIPFEGSTDWRDNCPELANIATIERIACNEIDYNTYAWTITSLWGLECIIESPEATCGAGFQYRSFACVDTRDVTRTPVSEEFCLRTTPPSSKRGCSILCRDNCGMAEWSPWGACSTSCGPGHQSRTRASPQGTASSCGPRNETRICLDNPPCQVVEYQYGRHGLCRPSNASEICGEGVQFREVVCVLNGETQPDTSLCSHLVPPNTTASPCTVPCPGQCVVGQWSPWTPCPDVCPDRSCMQRRFREKLRDGLDCPRTIRERSCPVVIDYFQWRERDWLDCIPIVSGNTDYCGNGTQYRIVECIDSRTNGSARDDQCSGEKPDTIRPCQIQCPIDCQVGPFSAWTDCPDSCDFSSYQFRSREILIPPSDRGRECPSLEQQKPCLPTNCDRYVLEAHDDYCSPEYTVSSTCGSTLSTVPLTCRRNNRFVPLEDCLRAASNGLTVDGPSETESYCNFQCPYQPNCSFTEWSDWSTCLSLCYRPELEGGFSFRSRTLLRAFDSISAVQCLGQQYEQQPCGTEGSTTSEDDVSCLEFHWEALEWTADGTRDTVCQSGTGIEVSDNGCVPAIRPVEMNGTCRTECSEAGYCNPSTGDCECYHLYEMVGDVCLPLSGCFWDGHCLYPNTMCSGESTCVCLNGRELQNGMCVEPPTGTPTVMPRPTVTPRPTLESRPTSEPRPTTPYTDDPTALPTGMVTMTTSPTTTTEGPTVGTEDSQSDSFGVLPIVLISSLPLVVVIVTVLILIAVTYRCRKQLEKTARRPPVTIGSPTHLVRPTAVEEEPQGMRRGADSASSGIVDDIENELYKYGMAGRTFRDSQSLQRLDNREAILRERNQQNSPLPINIPIPKPYGTELQHSTINSQLSQPRYGMETQPHSPRYGMETQPHSPRYVTETQPHSPRYGTQPHTPRYGMEMQPHSPRYVTERQPHSPRYGVESPRHKVDIPRYGMESPGHRMASPRYGMESPGHRTASPQYGMESPGHRTASPRYGMESPGHRMASPYSQSSQKYGIESPHSQQYGMGSGQYRVEPERDGMESQQYGMGSGQYRVEPERDGMDSQQYGMGSGQYRVEPERDGMESLGYGTDMLDRDDLSIEEPRLIMPSAMSSSSESRLSSSVHMGFASMDEIPLSPHSENPYVVSPHGHPSYPHYAHQPPPHMHYYQHPSRRRERIATGLDGPLVRAIEELAETSGTRSPSAASGGSRSSSRGSRRSGRRRYHRGTYPGRRSPHPVPLSPPNHTPGYSNPYASPPRSQNSTPCPPSTASSQPGSPQLSTRRVHFSNAEDHTDTDTGNVSPPVSPQQQSRNIHYDVPPPRTSTPSPPHSPRLGSRNPHIGEISPLVHNTTSMFADSSVPFTPSLVVPQSPPSSPRITPPVFNFTGSRGSSSPHYSTSMIPPHIGEVSPLAMRAHLTSADIANKESGYSTSFGDTSFVPRYVKLGDRSLLGARTHTDINT